MEFLSLSLFFASHRLSPDISLVSSIYKHETKCTFTDRDVRCSHVLHRGAAEESCAPAVQEGHPPGGV